MTKNDCGRIRDEERKESSHDILLMYACVCDRQVGQVELRTFGTIEQWLIGKARKFNTHAWSA